MRRAITIQNELSQIRIIEDLTEVFESVASMHISRIRNRVVASQQFFAELWPTYRSLRIDPKERVATTRKIRKGHDAFVAITSEGKLGSAVDEQIIDTLLASMPTGKKPDILIIGSHGITRLQQHGVSAAKAFVLPATDVNFSVGEIVDALEHYDQISVFYQTYESLRSQSIERIELLTAVRELGEGMGEEGETVSSRDYIFEPNISEIATYMESVMMGVALIQVIMDSKLAGYAARFNNMSRAKQRAKDLVGDMQLDYYRTKRNERDERIQEIMKVVHRGRK
ncbi:MAG TPA: F0F1 ATP synthase subunit gamma [Magnetospirillaceae bacterium]|nr:F0F1 ATP synthase subunit gamma [Magnetospirillaceae bacterium]